MGLRWHNLIVYQEPFLRKELKELELKQGRQSLEAGWGLPILMSQWDPCELLSENKQISHREEPPSFVPSPKPSKEGVLWVDKKLYFKVYILFSYWKLPFLVHPSSYLQIMIGQWLPGGLEKFLGGQRFRSLTINANPLTPRKCLQHLLLHRSLCKCVGTWVWL